MRPHFLLLLLVPGLLRAADLQPLRLGLAIPSYVHAVAWIAHEEGFFAEEGLAPEIQVMGGSAATMRALVGDNLDLGLAGGDAAMKAQAAGADLVVVAGLVNGYYHRLVARQDLAGPEALRGQKVGLGFLGGPQDMAVRAALQRFGLEPGLDVEVLNLGKDFHRIAALRRGDIQATTSQAPPELLAEMGLKVLADLPTWDLPFPYATVVLRRDTLEARRPVVQACLRALARGVSFYRDPANQAASLAVLARHLQGGDVEGGAALRYRRSGPGFLSPELALERAGFEAVLRRLPAAQRARVDLERLLDPTPRREALEAPPAP